MNHDAKQDDPLNRRTKILHATHLFFDLDGTISDSRQGIVACLSFALNELGVEVPGERILSSVIGPPLRSAFKALLNTSDPDVIERAVAAFRQQFAETGIYENVLYDEIPATLSSLQSFGFHQFVVTSRAQVFAERVVDYFDLRRFFQAVHGPSLTGLYDNKTELVAHLLEEMSLIPSSVVMIGDRVEDIVAGRANGCRTIGVTYGYGTESDLRANGADALVSAPHQLIDLLSFARAT